MKAQELRIGNIINTYGTNGNPEGWSEVKCCAEHIKTCYSHPKWFKGVGLTSKKIDDLNINYDLVTKAKIGMFYGEIKINYGHNSKGHASIGRNIKYIHELQNLYFALTGKELKTK